MARKFMTGTYQRATLPLPSVTASVDQMKVAARGMGAWGSRSAFASRRTMAGVYDRGLLDRYGVTPHSYLGAIPDVAGWARNNPGLAVATGLGVALLFLGGRRRRRR